MKLVALRLENFRSFEHCELDLQRDGLIGVSGPNGAGKTTLLSAINYALFGRGRGSRERPPERDEMPSGAACEVELQFILDDRHCEVLRGPNKARLTVDGDLRVPNGQEAVTRAITEILGVGQLNFGMTFYARQREIQALKPGPARKAALEALLGIDRVRNAFDLAREAQREQEAVVRALSAQLPSLADVEAALARAEEEARLRAPTVDKARQVRGEAAKSRDSAWRALTEARARAQEAFALERNAAVAASELSAAEEREKAAREALTAAQRASKDLEALEPSAAKAGELRARDRTLELEAQANAQAEALREKRHQAQVAAVAAADKLAEKPDPAPRLRDAEVELKTAREKLEAATTDMIAMSSRQEAARVAAAEAMAALANGRGAVALDKELSGLAALPATAEQRASTIAALDAEATQLAARVAEEREHYEHVKRDGPRATCPRCKQPYEGRYETILAEFNQSLAGFAERAKQIKADLRRLDDQRKADAPKLARLQSAKAERQTLASASTDIGALAAAADAAEAARTELTTSEERLRENRAALAKGITALDREIELLRAELTAREQLGARKRDAERDLGLYEKQLGDLSPNGYDPKAHEMLRVELEQATASEVRCVELRATAGQVELLTTRHAREERLAGEAAETHRELAAAAAKRLADKSAQEQAEAAYARVHKLHEEAEEALRIAEQQAVAESNAVAQARADLDATRRQKGQLDKAREEESLRRVVAAVLDAYRTAIQQEAVPSLEQETADLLRRVTRGRYSDVEITSDGNLKINDMGTAHDLERFSGGEQDLANLCMRIALSKVMARRSGMDARFIILDEVFGSQDPDRRAALVEALRELDQEFGQVLIVSHFDDFMDHCGLQITVKSVDGTSRAELATK
jgi:exonuclease SbcC